ncbi:colanic acid biosynthesis glycosyl transferase WcaI [Paraburkholderia bannensis]|uniref:Colanic acid biosynthesis glycosyl transferase WcaI n=1 Tax=Paraburkholderia bannensis TaxID=765414 RepID=A0A7W9TSL5_9BURK|nr:MULTISPECIES: glycosyltransferase WbuB [Paraburkholderia]MBB3255245.1 colanic acid biosynthesis glycosyl transferase WcaI [Paraburkholderia sp. WP4_3_2]MBB6100743.1 colanic acid biosynthesis glycosyl transferase WcaI [Paraburkholderia bannensis]
MQIDVPFRGNCKSKNMKILIYGINYAPELTGIGKYTAEMSEALSSVGHEVRVICAPPYYPHWRIAQGFSACFYEHTNSNGVEICRAPLWVPSRPKGVRRILHLASFAVSSFPIMLRQAFWRPNVVICVAPSLMNAPAAWLVAALSRAHAWLHVQDFEVDAAFNLGMLNGSFLKRSALAVERILFRRFDTISTISSKMAERALRKGVVRSKIVHFPNWADVDAIQPLATKSPMRAELNIPDGAIVVLYSGNMGAKQGLEVLANVAVRFSARDDIFFVFCGNGPARSSIATVCGGERNCRFLDLQPVERLNDLLNLADIHVLPQRADAADLVLPSKLTGMFSSGRAVIAMANPGTEIHDIVLHRGLVVAPEDPVGLAAAIERLSEDAVEREKLGKAGREFAKSMLSRDAVLAAFEKTLRARSANTI